MFTQRVAVIFFTIILLTEILAVHSQKRVPYKPCKKTDPQLNSCIKVLATSIIDNINLNFGDTRSVKPTHFEFSRGAINLKNKNENIVMKGMSKATVIEAKNNIQDLKIAMKMKLPRVEITGNYQVDGQFVVPVEAKGKFQMIISDMISILKLQLKKVNINGKSHYKISKTFVDFEVKGAQLKMKEERAKELEDFITTVFNENALYFVHQFKDAINGALVEQLQEVFQKEFDLFPTEHFFI